MNTELFRASTRGHQNHGWLDSHHTFSFASYYNPNRMNFGVLRIVNDDIVEGGKGFGKHPHDNMEIVSIPIHGALEHQDSMGHKSVIGKGEVQVMSAGSGIMHSEFNSEADKPVNFFQIWIFPNEEGVEPRYDQKYFDIESHKNNLVQIISPDGADNSLWLHQDAWFHLGVFDKDQTVDYKLNRKEHGVFAMVIEGEFEIEDQILHYRDAIGISETDSIQLKSLVDDARILLIEVPMKF